MRSYCTFNVKWTLAASLLLHAICMFCCCVTSRQSHILAVVSTKIVSVMIKITILDSSFWSNGTSSPGKSRQQELSTPTTFKWTYVACAVKSAWFQGFYHSAMNC